MLLKLTSALCALDAVLAAGASASLLSDPDMLEIYDTKVTSSFWTRR